MEAQASAVYTAAQAEAVLHQFVLARRAIQVFPPANPAVDESVEKLAALVGALFDAAAAPNPEAEGPFVQPAAPASPLFAGVARDAFMYAGEKVGEQYRPLGKFAEELYRQGVKVFWLAPGADKAELRRFLDVLCETAAADAEDARPVFEAVREAGFAHIGLERVDVLRLIDRGARRDDMDLLDYLLEREARKHIPGLDRAMGGDGSGGGLGDGTGGGLGDGTGGGTGGTGTGGGGEDLAALSAFFLELSEGSEESRAFLLRTLGNPERLGETLSHLAKTQQQANASDGVSINVLREALHHMGDALGSLTPDARSNMLHNIVAALQGNEEGVRTQIIGESLLPHIAEGGIEAELCAALSDEDVADLLCTHVRVHSGTANTITNFLGSYGGTTARRQAIKEMAASRMAAMDDPALAEIAELLRLQPAEAPSDDGNRGAKKAREKPAMPDEEARQEVRDEVQLGPEDLDALRNEMRQAGRLLERDMAVRCMLSLYLNGEVEEVSHGMLVRVKGGLEHALKTRRYAFITDVFETIYGQDEQTRDALVKALHPCLTSLASPQNLMAICRRLRELERGDAEYRCWCSYLRSIVPRAAPIMFEFIAREQERSFRQFLLSLFLELGDVTVAYLRKKIVQDRWYVTRNVAYLLGQFKSEAGIDALTTVLTHEDERVRREVVTALGHIRGERAEQVLLDCLEGDDVHCAALAAEWLGVRGGQKALPVLARMLRDDARRLRREPRLAEGVIQAVGKLGGRTEAWLVNEFARNLGFTTRHRNELAKACQEAVEQIEHRASGRTG